jgi:EAL domain-containing protein (putative c-di-GMP-specific phosphodiesterase class I)
MMADPTKAMDTLTALDKMNLYLSVDDFGTGFSSLAYLKKLPVNELKIDKSFVIGMLDDANDGTIVRSTIDLAHNLGLKVVAEGVENEKTFEMLKILGCDVIQGYHLGKPMPAAQFSEWFSQFNRLRSIA